MSCCDRNHPQVGDRVYIIREEHGWLDGSVQGVVKEVVCNPPKTVSYLIVDDQGEEYFCPKTGDCRKV